MHASFALAFRSSAIRSATRPRRPPRVPEVYYDPRNPHVDLVGPPDPISNIRPIRYATTSHPPTPVADLPSPSITHANPAQHPPTPPRRSSSSPSPSPSYPPIGGRGAEVDVLSLAAIRRVRGDGREGGEGGEDYRPSFYSLEEFPREGGETGEELAYRLQREALDGFNQAFWASNNTRFSASLAEVLSSLPPPADPNNPTQAEQDGREDAIAAFHKRWLEQEGPAQRRWMREWWGGQYGVLKAWWRMWKKQGGKA